MTFTQTKGQIMNVASILMTALLVCGTGCLYIAVSEDNAAFDAEQAKPCIVRTPHHFKETRRAELTKEQRCMLLGGICLDDLPLAR